MCLLCGLGETLCANDAVNLLLRFLLHVRIERHCKDEGVKRRSGRLTSAEDCSKQFSLLGMGAEQYQRTHHSSNALK